MNEEVDSLEPPVIIISARTIYSKCFQNKAQTLSSVALYFISAPVVRNIVSGTTGYLHYKIDEEKLLSKLDLKAGCHYALENRLRKEVGPN